MIKPAQLKRDLLTKGHSKEKVLLINCTEVIKIVGGYEKFLKLPIPTFFEILDALKSKAEIEAKEAKKANRKRK